MECMLVYVCAGDVAPVSVQAACMLQGASDGQAPDTLQGKGCLWTTLRHPPTLLL